MAAEISVDYTRLKARVKQLAKGPSDRSAVEAKLKKLSTNGIPAKATHYEEIVAKREEILDRVQKMAEEYEQVDQNCAKSPALALMEEFGFGHLKIITALSCLPGVTLTGETCGSVLGGLVALSSYFGSEDLLDFSANAQCYGQCRKFIKRFEEELGTTKCREIHEKIVFGTYHQVADRNAGFPAFLEDKGFEKCALAPGVSARIAAEIILEDMMKKKA